MTTPAGWYDDGSGNQRWWDGNQWTEHVVTVPHAAVVEQAEPVTPEVPGAPGLPGAVGESEPIVAPAADTAAFAPPYQLPSAQVPVAPGYAPAAGATGQGTYGAPGAPWAVAPAPQPAPGVSVLGIVGLAVVVIGVVCACIPVIAIAGWGLLGVGFVLSLVSLFLRGRKWPGITGMALAAIGAILAIAVSFILLGATSVLEGESTSLGTPSERPPADEGSTAEEGTDPSDIEGAEMVPFAELEVGDCIPLFDYGDAPEIFELPVVPCDQPHTDEVFFILDLEGDEFPGDVAVEDAAWDACLAEFEGYVGVPYDMSELDFYTYPPTKVSWVRAGDRTVQCMLFSYDEVTGSLQGAKY